MGPSLPPPDPALYWVGEEDPRRGRRQRELCVDWGLEPDADVLEIGCGTGRLAYELAQVLDGGSYAGFDISPEPIAWLDQHYASQLDHFRFDLVDVANARFRPDGVAPADQVRFPYPDQAFDFVAVFDVFMHLRRPDIETYLGEIRRVLRPGGRVLMTVMAINDRDESPGQGGRKYVPLGGGVHTRYPERDDLALAYDDALVRQMIDGAGLRLEASVEGRWHRPFTKREGRVPAADLYVASAPGSGQPRR